LQTEGVGKIIGWVHEQTPWQLGALFTSTDNDQHHRPMITRFIRAYQKGLADYSAAFLAKDSSGKRVFGDQAQALMPVLEKWIDPKPSFETVQQAANYMDPQGRLRVQSVYEQVAWYQKQGLVDTTVKPADFLDLSFVPGQ
jgi:NitT/TauT family transport system substrate-binding protein